MRMSGVILLAAAAGLAACAGPADPSSPNPELAYRTGSRIKQPDVPQPGTRYIGGDQFGQSPNFQVSGAFAHSTPTIVPPPPEANGQ